MDGDFIDGRLKYYYSFFEDIMYTLGFATLLAILIAAFGLLGMATYSTRTRLKEIGSGKYSEQKPVTWFCWFPGPISG